MRDIILIFLGLWMTIWLSSYLFPSVKRKRGEIVKRFIILLLISVLSSCASKSPYPAFKEGVTEQEKKKDIYECKIEAHNYVAPWLAGLSTGTDFLPVDEIEVVHKIEAATLRRCLESRGYTVTQTEE